MRYLKPFNEGSTDASFFDEKAADDFYNAAIHYFNNHLNTRCVLRLHWVRWI